MFTLGDKVYIEDRAEEDCHAEAWKSIQTQRYGIVRHIRPGKREQGHRLDELAIEFPEPFDGGHYCNGHCLPRKGQFVTSTNVTLCFEDSRTVETVPHFIDLVDHNVTRIPSLS